MHQKAGIILTLFRQQDGYISGGEICRILGVSRTAIWKHMSSLRRVGYVIDAVPSRGYRLVSSPDLLNREEIVARLDTSIIGKRLICLDETVSTNTEAFSLGEEGAAEGTVVIADAQSGGKGRRGRFWLSPAGTNLYCSVVLRPKVLPYQAPQLTFLSAVAVARAIKKTTGLQPEIKWPNDVLLDGCKVAGMLNEMSAETDGINFVILGIGINLNMVSSQFPGDLRNPATSLFMATGIKVIRAHFAAALLNELDSLYCNFLDQGFDPVREEWQKHCNASGREILVSDAGVEIVRGTFAGIDDDGALLLRRINGEIERILSGDVRVL
ncbi:MAG: biotin--[acetyl-CoA-carboxylase] ligase [Deltaproteobacteria bacterium]